MAILRFGRASQFHDASTVICHAVYRHLDKVPLNYKTPQFDKRQSATVKPALPSGRAIQDRRFND